MAKRTGTVSTLGPKNLGSGSSWWQRREPPEWVHLTLDITAWLARHPKTTAWVVLSASLAWWFGSLTPIYWLHGGLVVLAAGVSAAAAASPGVRRLLQRAYRTRQRRRQLRRQWPETMEAIGFVGKDGVTIPTLKLGFVTGHYVKAYVRVTRVGKDSEKLVAAAPAIAADLEARSVKVTPTSPTNATVVMRWGSDPLAESLPPNQLPTTDRPNHVVLGITEDGEAASVTYRTSCLLGGLTGSGKSVATWSFLAGIVSMGLPIRLWVVDPKEGMELGPLEHVAYRYVKTADESALRLLLEAEGVMRAKAARMRSQLDPDGVNLREHTATMDDPHDLLIVDDVLALPKAARKDTDAPLVRMAFLGRAPGMTLWLSAQSGDLNTLGDVRRYIPNRLCFATDNREFTEAILGAEAEKSGARCSKINRTSEKGVGYQLAEDDGRDFVRFRTALVHNRDIPRIVRGLEPLAVRDLRGAELAQGQVVHAPSQRPQRPRAGSQQRRKAS